MQELESGLASESLRMYLISYILRIFSKLIIDANLCEWMHLFIKSFRINHLEGTGLTSVVAFHDDFIILKIGKSKNVFIWDLKFLFAIIDEKYRICGW